MSPILIAGLVLVCIAIFYFFDVFGVKKWADKTFGKKTANKFVSNAYQQSLDYVNDWWSNLTPEAKLLSKSDPPHNFCKPGEIITTKIQKNEAGDMLLVYECHDKTTRRLTRSEGAKPPPGFCKPGEIPSTRFQKNGAGDMLRVDECHDKTGKLRNSEGHLYYTA